MSLYTIEIDRLTCERVSKAKSLDQFFDEHPFGCAMQYDGRYLVDKEIRQKFYVTNTEGDHRFIPQFLIDLDQFPIYVVAFDRYHSTHEAVELLNQEKIIYQIYDPRGVPFHGNELKSFFVLMKIETGEALFNIFHRYLYFIAESHFVGFWLKELPCFSFHRTDSIKGRSTREPILLVDMKHWMITVFYDVAGIEIHDKHGMWTYEKWKRQLSSFSMSQYTETGYSCCDE